MRTLSLGTRFISIGLHMLREVSTCKKAANKRGKKNVEENFPFKNYLTPDFSNYNHEQKLLMSAL